MFAPLTARPAPKGAARLAGHRGLEGLRLLARRFDQATLEGAERTREVFGNGRGLLPERVPSLTSAAPGGHYHGEPDRAGEGAQVPARPARVDLSFDFSKISILRGRQAPALLPPAGILQPKLAIGAVDDPLEREADAVAEQVMRMPEPTVSLSQTPIQLHRKCAACEQAEQLSRASLDSRSVEMTGSEAPPIVHEVLHSPGQSLDPAVRAFFEPRFGYDFSGVRVHTDASANESAKRIHAHAYTVGSDLVFGSGVYSPKTKTTLSLLAHELTHVIQQRHAPPKAPLPQSIGNPHGKCECQAETVANRTVDMGGSLNDYLGSAVQRQADYTDETEAANELAQEPFGSIDITEALFEEDIGGPVDVQAFPDSAMGPFVQRQSLDDIPPPPPAYPSIYDWFFDITSESAVSDPGSLFGLTCSDGSERGYYIMWNENTNKSFPGPVVMGAPARRCSAAELSLGPVPADRKPIYPVGFFHTHPLANPGCRKLGVGPSATDNDTAKSTGLPGLVIDTRTPTSSCGDAGYFFFGPVRRS